MLAVNGVNHLKDELEVRCPECGKLFKGESRMVEHLDKEHVSDRQHSEELVIEINARYLGSYPDYDQRTKGDLALYGQPHNRVVFSSAEFTFEIPIGKIKRAIAPTENDTAILLEYEDESGANQKVIFDHSSYTADFVSELLNLRVDIKTSQENIEKTKQKRGTNKFRCPYCKFTYDEALDKCPHCGAMNP